MAALSIPKSCSNTLFTLSHTTQCIHSSAHTRTILWRTIINACIEWTFFIFSLSHIFCLPLSDISAFPVYITLCARKLSEHSFITLGKLKELWVFLFLSSVPLTGTIAHWQSVNTFYSSQHTERQTNKRCPLFCCFTRLIYLIWFWANLLLLLCASFVTQLSIRLVWRWHFVNCSVWNLNSN